jgi:hypothetical protein
MKTKTFLMLTILLCIQVKAFAQITNTVRGKVSDNVTFQVLPDVKVIIFTNDSTKRFVVKSDEMGLFEFLNVPIGKHTITFSSPSYLNSEQTLTVNVGKELVLEISLQERIKEVEEVIVEGRKKGEVINELALVSAKQFSVEETNRYAGSRSDPARMASNFAGVQGADDSRNDIVIRGNSPLGLVWKVEGIDLPNPNHFAISGSTGGPVSILNNKLLGNSDFFMSAFPAEYGNSLSGVFDLKLRNGNNKQHEFTGQFGFLGTEFLAEGPLSKKSKASFLIMGRYSTLSIFQSLGIKIGTNAVPQYGDASFKFNFPLKKGGNLSFFGIAGKSAIQIKISDQKEFSKEFYGEGDRDQYFGTSMAVFGTNYKKSLNEKTFFSATLAVTMDEQHANHNYLIRSLDTVNPGANQVINIRLDSIYPLMGYYFRTTKTALHFAFNRKINKQHLIRFGMNNDFYYFNNLDSVLNTAGTEFLRRWDFKGTSLLIQPFVQWKWRIQEKMDFTFGLHSQYFSMSNSISYVEPRAGFRYGFGKANTISAGAGMHSQTQPLYQYTYRKKNALGNYETQNRKMDFSKSIHTVLGYEKSFSRALNFKIETYYQYLYNIPVETKSSANSLINQGSGFARFFPDTLKNTGIGYNYGLEITLQKFFSKTFYFLTSGSVYNSKYQGSDKIWRNTSYNSNYSFNFLAGKEFVINQKNSISLGTKITYSGGRRYGYVNTAASLIEKELIYKDSAFNQRQFKPYFRLDIKLAYKLNTTKVTHEFGLDLVNLLNTRNLLSLAYAPNLANPSAEPIAEKTQLGFLPIFYWKIDFKLSKPKQ